MIGLYGPFTFKEAAAVGERGFDVISDHAHVNVSALHLCRFLNEVKEPNPSRRGTRLARGNGARPNQGRPGKEKL